MPRTKRPVRVQEKTGDKDDVLKKLDKIVAEQKANIDSRVHMECRNVDLAFKMLLGTISNTVLNKTIGQLKNELHIKEVGHSTRKTRNSSRATSHDDDAESGPALVREPRGHRKRLCRKYGICGNQGFGGQQGFQQGYQQGYPPAINIGISQSQSSAAAGGGGYSNGYYPNNNQFNGPQPGYGGYQGFGGHPNQGYGGRPGFSNGQEGYNNQFNGNYYGPGAGNGYGFPGPFQGGYHDEAQNNDDPAYDDHNDLSQQEQNDQALFGDHSEPHSQGSQGPHGQGPQGPHGPEGPYGQGSHGHGQDYAVSGSFAFAGRKNN